MKPQVQIGWVVCNRDGKLMFWPVDELAEATNYCEDGAQPVAMWANTDEMDRHYQAQEDA